MHSTNQKQSDSETILKPCPFCGVVGEKASTASVYYFRHTESCFMYAHLCHVNTVPHFLTPAWNRRAEQSPEQPHRDRSMYTATHQTVGQTWKHSVTGEEVHIHSMLRLLTVYADPREWRVHVYFNDQAGKEHQVGPEYFTYWYLVEPGVQATERPNTFRYYVPQRQHDKDFAFAARCCNTGDIQIHEFDGATRKHSYREEYVWNDYYDTIVARGFWKEVTESQAKARLHTKNTPHSQRTW